MLNKRLINTGEAAAAAFDPLQNFEIVTYTGNGGTQKITGYIRKGAAFNGSSSYIDTGITNTVGTRSISLWFYYTSAPASNEVLIGAVSSGSAGYTIRLETSVLKFQHQGESTASTALSNLNVGWNHVVGVIDGSTSTLYLNGSSVGTGGVTDAGSHNLYIGANNDVGSAGSYFDGKIDQVRIFDKAISSSEVTTLYNEDYDSSTKSTTDIFGDGSGVALYELDDSANDTGGTYNGTATNVNFLGMAFQPDLVWTKERNIDRSHDIYDSVRGAGKKIASDSTAAEVTETTSLTSFDSNGFTLGSGSNVNHSGRTYVAWCWKAGGAAVSGTGTNASSITQSENTDAGFGIYKFTTTSSSGVNVSISHNLNAAPELVFVKVLGRIGGWYTYHKDLLANQYLRLESNGTPTTGTSSWGGGMTTSSLGFRTDQVVYTNYNHVAYAFHSVDGYQKVGSYTGDGTTNGTKSIDVGFQPRFVLIKSSSATGEWLLWDSQRISSGQHGGLYPSTSGAETAWSNSQFNIISTGFEVGRAGNSDNYDNNDINVAYIYLAIA